MIHLSMVIEGYEEVVKLRGMYSKSPG